MEPRAEAQGRVVRVNYTAGDVRSAATSLVWRRGIVERRALWALDVIVLALVMGMTWHQPLRWLAWILCAGAALSPALRVARWASIYAHSMNEFQRLSARQAEFSLSEHGLVFRSELGGREIRWQDVVEVWCRPEGWMVFTTAVQFLLLPVSGLSEEDRAYVEASFSNVLPPQRSLDETP